MCHLGFQWFNREILHGLSNFGQGEEQGTCVQLHPEKFILCCKAKHQMWFATFGLNYPRSSVKGPFCGWCLGAKHGSFSDGNGWLGRNVTLENYDYWAIRITKANINLGVLWVCQLCELQMYALMNTLLHHQRQNFLMHATLVEMTFIIRAHAYYIHGPSSDSLSFVLSDLKGLVCLAVLPPVSKSGGHLVQSSAGLSLSVTYASKTEATAHGISGDDYFQVWRSIGSLTHLYTKILFNQLPNILDLFKYVELDKV